MRAAWALVLATIVAGLTARAMPPRVAPSRDAQILAAPVPGGAPFEPTSPEPAQRQQAPFVVEVLSPLLLADSAPATALVAAGVGLAPRSAHARRIERPPIPPRSPS